jgi:hypothetical protein
MIRRKCDRGYSNNAAHHWCGQMGQAGIKRRRFVSANCAYVLIRNCYQGSCKMNAAVCNACPLSQFDSSFSIPKLALFDKLHHASHACGICRTSWDFIQKIQSLDKRIFTIFKKTWFILSSFLIPSCTLH